MPWSDVSDALAVADLNAIESTLANYPHRTLFGAFRVSFDTLARESREAADRYLSLAVFPKSLPIPETAVVTLWSVDGLSEREAKRTIAKLAGRALIRLETSEERRNISIHDLLMDFVKFERPDNAAAHDDLLRAYRGRHPSWADVRADGYIFEHLAYHLRCAGRREELDVLLVDVNYLQAKLNATGIGALLSDFNEASPAGEVVRRALMLSIAALAKEPRQLPAHLIGRLPRGANELLDRLVQAAHEFAPVAALLPCCPCMVPADSSLRLLLSDAVPLGIDTSSHHLYALENSCVTVRDLNSGALLSKLILEVTSALVTRDCKALLTQHGDTTSWTVWSLPGGLRRATLQTGVSSRASVSDFGGHFLLTCDHDSKLSVWDLDSCRRIASFDSGVGDVSTNLAASSGAEYLVGASRKQLLLWRVEDECLLQWYPEQPTEIDHVAITPEATVALSSGADGLVRIYDLIVQQELGQLDPCGGSDPLVQVTENNRAVIGAPFVGLSVWNLETRTLLKRCSERGPDTLVISREGMMASTASSYERRLRLWDLEGTSDSRIGHGYVVRRVAIEPDGRFAVSSAYEELKLWDVQNGRDIVSNGRRADEFGGWRNIWLSRDAERVVVQHWNGDLIEWSRFEIGEPRALPFRGELVALSSDGEFLVLRVSPTEVGLFDRQSRAVSLVELDASEPLDYLHLAMSRRLDILYQFYNSGLVIATDMRSGLELARIRLASHERIWPWSAVASRDAVWWHTHEHVYKWDLQTDPEIVVKLGSYAAMAVSFDGRSLVYGTDSHTVRVRDNVRHLQDVGLTLDGRIAELAISDDGSTIVAGDDAGRVYFAAIKQEQTTSP